MSNQHMPENGLNHLLLLEPRVFVCMYMQPYMPLFFILLSFVCFFALGLNSQDVGIESGDGIAEERSQLLPSGGMLGRAGVS